jgi:hypothetical protein
MEYLVFALVVAVIAVVGIRVGMLLAPRIDRVADRLTAPDDEEPRD